MMDLNHNIPTRSTRNRVIDLLGVGDTYPISDLNVVIDQLKVAFGATAKIPIENAQIGVSYQLCDPKGNPLGDAFKADGDGTTLVIETPKVSEDVTYRILATKIPTSDDLPAQSPRFLDQNAPTKVGIDTGLLITLNAPPLDSANPDPQPSDPRIAAYGASVDLQVNGSQEGVQYSLVIDDKDLKQPTQMGDLGTIVLPTGPMTEDAVVQVRATKTFLASEKRDTQTELLDTKLYLKVIANPGLDVTVTPSAIIDYQQDTTVQISATQASVKYRAYMRSIPDCDFIHGTTSETNIVTVPVTGKPDVQVRKPTPSATWKLPGGYSSLGDVDTPGDGGDLKIKIPPLTEDAIVIVQAVKEHQIDNSDPAAGTINSAIALNQAAVILVRPDRARALKLRIPIVDAQTADTMEVSGGQPGVFYYFLQDPSGKEFPLPAYFHKRDERDSTQNKGINQLGMEIDFVVATDPDVRALGGITDPAKIFPRSPLLDITPFATGSNLSARAVKAQTGVEIKMTQGAPIDKVPAISADQGVIDFGGTAKIIVSASNPKEQYQVLLQGVPVKSALAGDKTDLAVLSDVMTVDAIFEVSITTIAPQAIQVERIVRVPVFVRPNTALVVKAKLDTVPKDSGTEITVQQSQSGVNYQLMSGKTAVGSAVIGNGTDIVLPTGPIGADMTFNVTATRSDNPQISSVLKTPITVKIAVS